MQLLVFGASGKVGKLVTAEALRRGHLVIGVIHNGSLNPCQGLTVVKADIYNHTEVENLVKDVDGVLIALSSWHTKSKNIVSTATATIVQAMQKQGIKRVVSLTGNLASAKGDKTGLVKYIFKSILHLVSPKVLNDGDNHIANLENSKLDWTTVRSPIMTNQSNPAYSCSLTEVSLTIPRIAVAICMLDLVETSQWVRRAPLVSAGK